MCFFVFWLVLWEVFIFFFVRFWELYSSYEMVDVFGLLGRLIRSREFSVGSVSSLRVGY